VEEAWRRASGKGRPLARDRGQFEQLKHDREAVYETLASVSLPPMPRDGTRRAMRVLTALEGAPDGTRLAWASSASGEYPVFFDRGLVGTGFFHPDDGRRFVVTDANVAQALPFRGHETYVFPPGEQEKTLARAEDVLRFLAGKGATRDDVVVALGGGVAGDLAGFCAAIYQRGLRWVGIPTTLLAQVDSAYGGKTGVDLPEAKNYVGSYHQPAAVLVDPSALDSLPPEEAAAGYAEVVKTALIAGGPLWARVREGGPVDDETIWRCLRTKLSVVAEDERDAGRRQVLNLGHTVGHAIEAATGYGRYRHGEAIGIGLLAALRLSGREALRSEVADLLAARGLPANFEGAAVDDVLEYLARDKKRAGGRVPFVLVQAPGEVTPGHHVEADDLRAAVEEVEG
jgi:shikimate kinase/3-dehydroquinate synthase